MATADVALPSQPQPGTHDAASLLSLSSLAPAPASSPSLSGTSTGEITRNDSSEGEEVAQGDGAVLRGGYRCSKCGRPKRGHVCPTSGGSYMNLTFIDYDDKTEGEQPNDPEHRMALLRRVDLLEREVNRLANENSQLRAALHSHQSSGFPLNQNSFGSFAQQPQQQQQHQQPLPQIPQQQIPVAMSTQMPQQQQQGFQPPQQQQSQPRDYALQGDYDMQPQAKRPRFDHNPSNFSNTTSSPQFNHPNFNNPNFNPAMNPNQNFDASRMNMVNMSLSMESHPHPSAFSQPIMQQMPQQQMYMVPQQQQLQQMSSEHAWLRIPKPQTRVQNFYPSQGF